MSVTEIHPEAVDEANRANIQGGREGGKQGGKEAGREIGGGGRKVGS